MKEPNFIYGVGLFLYKTPIHSTSTMMKIYSKHKETRTILSLTGIVIWTILNIKFGVDHVVNNPYYIALGLSYGLITWTIPMGHKTLITFTKEKIFNNKYSLTTEELIKITLDVNLDNDRFVTIESTDGYSLELDFDDFRVNRGKFLNKLKRLYENKVMTSPEIG